jgi:hypothetical protein
MRDRQKGKLYYECDGCHDVLETDTGDVARAEEDRKATGWSAHKKDDGDWEHHCPKCQ